MSRAYKDREPEHRRRNAKPAAKPKRVPGPVCVAPTSRLDWRPLVITREMREAIERTRELYPEPMGKPW